MSEARFVGVNVARALQCAATLTCDNEVGKIFCAFLSGAMSTPINYWGPQK